MDGSKSAGQIVVRVHSAIEDIGLESWNACAFLSKEEKKRGRPDNPFTDYRFLHALEASGSARAETGWYPQHLAVEDENGTVLAVMPAYAKSHSQGEYIFDHAWADAFERAGGRYYPKLLSAVPFTPVTGPRLLVGPDKKGRTDKANALITGIAGVVERLDISSAHINFASEADATHLTDSGFLLRTDCQFHWKNNSFSTFDAFMETLASRKRKQLRKERRQALENGISIDWITGSDLTESVWDRFF
ncbi:MAG: peptidogalycan biosysnthesis protein, partial [Pseudomonadota bacterium]